MTVVKADSSQLGALSALEARLFEQHNYPLSPRAFRYHLKRNLIVVALDGQTVAGYALVLLRKRSAKLYSIGVESRYRGRGVAKSLLGTVCRLVADQGYDAMVLEVRCDNDQAIKLYHSFGAKVKRRLKQFYLDGEDAYLMEVPCAATTL